MTITSINELKLNQGEHTMTKKTFNEIFGADADEESLRKHYFENLPFTDKESYLKWVGEWKAKLQGLIDEIHTCKKNRKRYLRDEKGNVAGDNPSYDSYAAIKRVYLRDDVRSLLIARYFSKQKAGLQRQENLSKVA